MPEVTILMPCYNEAAFIGRALDSLVDGWTRKNCEFLIIDGGSRDGTQSIAAEFIENSGISARILDNPRRLQTFALNLGIKEARGQFIVRADAHCIYPADYVRHFVGLLAAKEETGVANVGGTMWPIGTWSVQKAIALAMRHPLGVGDAKFHLGTGAGGYVDTVFLGTFRKTLFDDIGVFDTHAPTNEDAELNLRILKAGKKVFLDPSMKILYYPRGSFRSLFRQYFRYGRGRAYTAWKHRKLTSWRQAGPVALVFYLFSSACLGVVNPFYWLLLLPYPLLVSTVAIVRPGWKKAPRGTDDERTASRALRPLLAYAFMTMHVSWGVGFIWASFRHILSPRGMRA